MSAYDSVLVPKCVTGLKTTTSATNLSSLKISPSRGVSVYIASDIATPSSVG